MDLIHRKERIIFTAIDVINELGVQSLSTKRIAQYENISESTVFKHYANKIQLLNEVLDFYAQYDKDLIETIGAKALTGLQGLRYLLDNLMIYYSNYPAITAITQGLDEMRYTEVLRSTVDLIVERRRKIMLHLIEEAKENRTITSEYQSDVLYNILIGTIQNLIREWRYSNFETSLQDQYQVFMATFFNMISPREHDKGGGASDR